MTLSAEARQQIEWLQEDLAELDKMAESLPLKTVICECCHGVSPQMYDGYTCCCNELQSTIGDERRYVQERINNWRRGW